MIEKAEKIGGSLVNIVLGALILWVGQTTFQHAGVLATVDQKFAAVQQQFVANNDRYEEIQGWMQKMTANLKENSLTQFSYKDGDKLQKQIELLDNFSIDLERAFAERLKSLELKIVALETRTNGLQNENELRWEVAQLRSALAQVDARDYSPVARLAERPSTLPPVTGQP